MHHVEQLPLVGVDPLDLNVEQRIRIDVQPKGVLDDARQSHFIRAFDVLEFGLKARIAGVSFQLPQSAEIGDPPVAHHGGDQIRQSRVRLQQPAPLRDAVGLVVESFREQLKEIRRERRLDQFGVNSGDAVDRMASDHGQIRHAHLLGRGLLDHRQPLDSAGIPSRPAETCSRNRRLISRMICRCRGSTRSSSGTGHFSSASGASV